MLDELLGVESDDDDGKSPMSLYDFLGTDPNEVCPCFVCLFVLIFMMSHFR